MATSIGNYGMSVRRVNHDRQLRDFAPHVDASRNQLSSLARRMKPESSRRNRAVELARGSHGIPERLNVGQRDSRRSQSLSWTGPRR